MSNAADSSVNSEIDRSELETPATNDAQPSKVDAAPAARESYGAALDRIAESLTSLVRKEKENGTQAPAVEGGTLYYSVSILLPDGVNREFRRWTKNAPGASWPSWGGHITLLPPFRTELPAEKVYQRVSTICATHSPINLCLDRIVHEQDWTRPSFRGVFIKMDREVINHSGARRLGKLRTDLKLALMSQAEDPALEQRAFDPHITLALGLSEREAQDIVEAARADKLSIRFVVRQIWLLGFNGSRAGSDNITRNAFALTGEDLEARDVALSAA